LSITVNATISDPDGSGARSGSARGGLGHFSVDHGARIVRGHRFPEQLRPVGAKVLLDALEKLGLRSAIIVTPDVPRCLRNDL
jgi:hypothetical protein